MIRGDNTPCLVLAHHHLSGGNYLITGDASQSCALLTLVHVAQPSAQKFLSAPEVFSSGPLGFVNEKINKVTQGTERLFCNFSVPNKNET